MRTVVNPIHIYVLLLHIWIIEIEIINASLIQSSDKIDQKCTSAKYMVNTVEEKLEV